MIDNNNKSQKTKQFLDMLLKEQSKELGLDDLLELQDKVQDPLVISALLFKLIEERKKTNKILENINEKYDSLQFSLKNNNKEIKENNIDEDLKKYNILSETDDKIISFIRENNKANAAQIKKLLNYKGTNAASQRLNKLVNSKLLKKIQSGRKVYFIIR